MTGLPFQGINPDGFQILADVTDVHGAELRVRTSTSGTGLWLTTVDEHGAVSVVGLFDVEALAELHRVIGAHLASVVTS